MSTMLRPARIAHVALRPLGVATAAGVLVLGLMSSTNASAAPAPTTLALAVSPATHSYGTASTVNVTVRDASAGAGQGVARIALDGAVLARVTLDASGQAAAAIPASSKPGRHVLSAIYLPTADGVHSGSSSSIAFQVARAAVHWTIKVPAKSTYGAKAAISVSLKGISTVTGRVSLVLGNKVIAASNLVRGSVKLDPKATWPTGRAKLRLSYAGSTVFAPSATSVGLPTARGHSTVTLSVPATVAFAATWTAKVSVIGAGVRPTGKVTVYVDGRAKASVTLSAGSANVAVPAMSSGHHRVTATYAGDTKYTASRQTTTELTTASPCPVSARACVDLTHSVAWLQSAGTITYGPVPMNAGRYGYRTDDGTFNVYAKIINGYSDDFDASMPYSVFFDGGIAFHEGDIYVHSHGCIHLTYDAAVTFFGTLQVGDEVFVYGSAPY